MWTDAEHDHVVKTFMVICEVIGTEVSSAAAQFMVKQLSAYPAGQVLGALERCGNECKYKLTLADVVSRLDDGRPGAEQAWSLFPKLEEDAGVVTDEMSAAWGVAAPLFEAGDAIGARMAFREVYERDVRRARASGLAVHWYISAGWDPASTESVAIEAVRLGRISEKHAVHFLRSDNLRLEEPAADRPEDGPEPEQLVADVSAAPDPAMTTGKTTSRAERKKGRRR